MYINTGNLPYSTFPGVTYNVSSLHSLIFNVILDIRNRPHDVN